MEKQNGKKIKMFQIDNIGEYKDQFLQFGLNNGIDIYFTIGRHGVAKEMNRSLLEKVRYLLSNASLDKTFWVEALEYASYLMTCLLSTTIEGKFCWIFGRVELLKTKICCGYLDVRPTLVSKMTS